MKRAVAWSLCFSCLLAVFPVHAQDSLSETDLVIAQNTSALLNQILEPSHTDKENNLPVYQLRDLILQKNAILYVSQPVKIQARNIFLKSGSKIHFYHGKDSVLQCEIFHGALDTTTFQTLGSVSVEPHPSLMNPAVLPSTFSGPAGSGADAFYNSTRDWATAKVGGNGGCGANGRSGVLAGKLNIYAHSFYGGMFYVRGGNGQKGSPGQDGGNGGNGLHIPGQWEAGNSVYQTVRAARHAADGGRPGAGGFGGNGGSAGTIMIYVTPKNNYSKKNINFFVDAQGGSGGEAGNPGQAGNPGSPGSALIERDGMFYETLTGSSGKRLNDPVGQTSVGARGRAGTVSIIEEPLKP
ncbi:MAG: hypothetical protein HYS98_01435 [Deltaproteobacteria bacterium]|nr:hypothetical protein [Deltaproteobacteria bacterium]